VARRVKNSGRLLLIARPICGDLRAVAANGHAAPAPGVAAGFVQEEQTAYVAFARLDIGEILLGDEPGHRFRNRDQERLSGPPLSLLHHAEGRRAALTVRAQGDLAVALIAREDPVDRFQVLERSGRQRLASMLMDEGPEPFAQAARVAGDGVEPGRTCLFHQGAN